MSSQRTARLLALAVAGLAVPSQGQTGIEVAGHVLRRISYGPSPATLADLLPNATFTQDQLIDSFVDIQLAAGATDPSPVIAGVQLLPSPAMHPPTTGAVSWNVDNLARHNLAMALYSPNQLREVMVGFWQQHFNTAWFATKSYFDDQTLSGYTSSELATYFEYVQNQGFRTHALGSFRDLLEVSGRGVAMVIYLDSVNSTASGPNENYARELLELHTFGTDDMGLPNTYDEQDIDEIAKIFTGWTVGQNATTLDWEFQFDDNVHSTGSKPLFGGTPEATTINEDLLTEQEGLDLFDHLAASPVTADFVCRKLYRFFLSQDTIDTTLLASAVGRWNEGGVAGNIGAVLDELLKSTAMKTAVDDWDTVERPIEALTSTVRALDGSVSTFEELDFLYSSLNGPLAQSLFRFPSPDGFPFESFKQISSAQWLNRIRVHQSIDALYNSATSGSNPATAAVAYDLTTLFLNTGVPLGINLASEESIVRWFFTLLYQRSITDVTPSNEITEAIDFLTNDINGVPLSPDLATLLATDLVGYQNRLSELLQYLTSIPRSFQK